MNTFFDLPEWFWPRKEKPVIDVSDPPYDPAEHWGEDYFIDEPYEARIVTPATIPDSAIMGLTLIRRVNAQDAKKIAP